MTEQLDGTVALVTGASSGIGAAAAKALAEAGAAVAAVARPADGAADAVTYIVTRPRRVAVNELLVRAGEQTW
jgi:NADP-dependent 3-hydroxy acid dehydrogenase YdfG